MSGSKGFGKLLAARINSEFLRGTAPHEALQLVRKMHERHHFPDGDREVDDSSPLSKDASRDKEP